MVQSRTGVVRGGLTRVYSLYMLGTKYGTKYGLYVKKSRMTRGRIE